MSVWAPRAELVNVSEGLLKQRSFRLRVAAEQLQILFLVLQLRISAAEAKSELHRDVLVNTAAYFTSGSLRLRIDRGVIFAVRFGDAVLINPPIKFDVTKPLRPGAADYERLLGMFGALAHEVSHSISDTSVAGKVGYLIEEYRAYQVGFIAQNGRRPRRAESAAQILEVLWNPWRLTAYESLAEVFLRRRKTEPYLRFFRALDLDVEAVATEIAALRTPEFLAQARPASESEIRRMSTTIQERLIRQETAHLDSPRYGWPGFETNSRKTSRSKE